MPEQRRGFVYGLAAYLVWGLFPLYWKLLDRSGAIEVLAHRVLWSMVTIALLVVVLRKFGRVKAVLRDPRRRWRLIAAAVLISVNWGTYIWGVHNDRIVETSLGYFITPLFTVLLGVLVLKERLRRVQWAALAIAFVAVIGLTIENGRPPWVALILTFSFGLYGLAKKQAGAGAIEGMAIETATVAPVALAAIVVLGAQGQSTVADNGVWYLIVLLLAGPITSVPLMLFGAASTRVSMTTLGPAELHHAEHAVRARRAAVPRGDVADALGRLRAGVARAGDLHLGHDGAPAPDPVARTGRADRLRSVTVRSHLAT